MVDHPALPLGGRREEHLLDDLRQRVGVRLDRARERVAAERPEAHALHLAAPRRARAAHALVVDHDPRPVAVDDRPLVGEVERHDRDLLAVDVEPDVELGPVREREDADRLAAPVARVVEPPELGPLVLRVPAVLRRAEGEDPLLRARLLLVAPRPAEGGVEAVLVERLLEPLGLHHVGVHDRAAVERVDAARDAVLVHVHEEVDAVLLRHPGAEGVHLLELPRRVDVQERERRRRRRERLLGQAEHDRAVLADRVEHHRVLGGGDDLAHDVDRLGLEPLEMCEPNARDAQRLGLDFRGNQVELLEPRDHDGRRLGRRAAGGLEPDLRIDRLLVRRRDAGELLDLAGKRRCVETFRIAPRALLERRRDVDLDERRVLLDERARVLPHLLVRRDRGDDHGGAGARDARGDPADARDVDVAVLLREAEALREVRADDVAVEVLDDEAAPLELRLDDVRDRRLARARQAREPEDEACAVLVHVCSPHSVRSVPAQRPSRPLPGSVECVSPIES